MLDDDRHTIGAHPLIARFRKGVFNMRPTRSRYSSVWDVDCLLKWLRDLMPNDLLDLKFLTFKLCCLLALVTAQRVQSLHSLKLSNLTRYEDKVVFRLGLLKQSRPQVKSTGSFVELSPGQISVLKIC